jgi:hypothetical protein
MVIQAMEDKSAELVAAKAPASPTDDPSSR